MKKILLGMAAGAMALGASVVPAQAGPPISNSIWDDVQLGSTTLEQLVLIVPGYAKMLDECGNGKPFYTVFAPIDLFLDGVLDAIGLTVSDLSTQSAVLKGILDDHIVNGSVSPWQLENDSVTLLTARSGFQIVVSDSTPGPDNRAVPGNVLVSGQLIVGYTNACNGFIYGIAGFLDSTAQVSLEAANFAGQPKDGTSTANKPGGSLPDTL